MTLSAIEPNLAADAPRRTLIRQALVDTFSQLGARLGAIWIGIVVVLAVFAPFLANSFPIAMQLKDGSWQSPLLRSLTPMDIILVVLFAASVILFWRRVSLGKGI